MDDVPSITEALSGFLRDERAGSRMEHMLIVAMLFVFCVLLMLAVIKSA